MGKIFDWKNPSLADSKNPANKWLIFTVLTVLLFLTMFAIIPSAVGDAVIRGHFALSTSENDWVNTATLLGLVSSVPLSEHFARKLGFKFVLFLGTALFSFAFLVASFAPNYFVLILTRVINGVGSGLFVPISLTILAETFPKKQLAFAVALYSALGYGCGVSVAFAAGGYIAQYLNWYWPFLLTVLISSVPLIGIWLFIVETEKEEMHRFDFRGYFSYVFWLSILITLCVSAKAPWNTEGWTSNFMKACYLILGVCFVYFVYIELKLEKPLFNLRLFKINAFFIGNLMLFFVGAIYFATSLGFPPLLQTLLRYDKFHSGLALVAHGTALGLASGILGFVVKKIGIRIPLVVGGVFLASTCFLQQELSIYSDPYFVVMLLFLRGFAVGMSIGPVTALALKRVEGRDLPNATMIVTLCRQTGATIASAVISIFAVQRGEFHSARFFENIGEKSIQYMNTLTHNQMQIYASAGSTKAEAFSEAKGRIIDVIERQSTLAGLNDGYFALGVCSLTITLFLSAIMISLKLRGKLTE